MKRCPKCRRDYNDDSLSFCLDDGSELLFGPGSLDEGETAIFTHAAEARTRARAHPLNDVTAVFPGGLGPAGGRRSDRRVLILIVSMILFVIALAAAYRYISPAASKQIDSVAVMPFVNESGDADIEYLSDGLTESLINSLSQLPNISVKARSTVFHYKSKEITPQQIGAELSVQGVLNGHVVQRGDQLILSVELIDARTGNQIWGAKYTRRPADLVALQNEVARDVAGKLKVRLSGADEQNIAKNYPTSAEAYQLYLKGRFYLNQRTGDALRSSVEYFDKAIEKDSRYALAYAGLADAYSLFPGYSAGLPDESYSKAKFAARRALEIDETLAEAHTSLALLLIGEWNLADSNREFQRAIALNPNYPTAHHWYACNNLLIMRRFDEAIAEGTRAVELDPLSLIINADLGYDYIYARQYDKAIEQLQKTLALDQSFYYGHWQLGKAYEMKKAYPEAVGEYQKALQLNNDPGALAALVHCLGAAGQRAEALAKLQQLKDLSERRYVSAYNWAIAYAGLGDKEQALKWLEKGYEERYKMTYLQIEPLFDNLRSEPRFAELIRRVGLPE